MAPLQTAPLIPDLPESLRQNPDLGGSDSNSTQQYGYGDKFIGVVVPKQQKLIKIYKPLLLSLEEMGELGPLIHGCLGVTPK